MLPGSLVLLATGATEQHGPHLATGHDAVMINTVARQAGERAAAECTIVLAPTLPFGSSHHHLPFGGILSLSTETYSHVVRELVESMVSAGARRVFLLNGHGGNHEINQLVARDVAIANESDEKVFLAAASYWEMARAGIEADPRLPDLILPGHAGQFETATMLATDPTMVRDVKGRRDADPSFLPSIPGTRVETRDRWQRFDGFTDVPDRATAEQGEILLQHVVREVAKALVTFATLPDASERHR